MTAGQTRKVFRYYRCPNPDCRARAVISVANVEPVVVEAVKAAAANEEGRASVESGAAAIEAERARAKYDAAVEALDAFSDTAAVKKKLRDLLTKAEAAEERAERADQLGSRREIVRPAKDWDRLSLSRRPAGDHPGRGRARRRLPRSGTGAGPGRASRRVSLRSAKARLT
jgi:hypothetical protein